MICKRIWNYYGRPWDWFVSFFAIQAKGESIWAVFGCGVGWSQHEKECEFYDYAIWFHLFGSHFGLIWPWRRWWTLPAPWKLRFHVKHQPFPQETG